MIRNEMTGAYICNNESIEFNFYTNLSAYDKVKFVNSVTSILVDDDDYNYIIKDMIFDFYIIDIFAIDVDTSEIKQSPHIINDIEEFLEETNIVDIIKANAEDGLIEELSKAVDLNIEHRTGIHRNILGEALTSLVGTLEKKINEFDIGGMAEVIQSFTGMTDEMTMENLIKAYTSTDVFKKNQQELGAAKEKKNAFIDEVSKVIDISSKA